MLPVVRVMEYDTLRSESRRIGEFHKELQLGAPPELARSLVRRIRAWVENMQRHIRSEHGALLERYAERFATFMGRPANPGRRPKDEAGAWYWTYKVGAYAALLFETLVAATVAAQIFALQTLAAAGVGVLITLVTAAIFKAACGLAVAHYESHPQKAMAQLHGWLKIAFPLWLLSLLGTLIVGQMVTESSPAIEWFFVLSRTVLSLLSPLMAAILLTCAKLVGWSRRFAADYIFLERLEFQLEELEQYCEEVEKRLVLPREEETTVATPATPAHKKAAVPGVAFAALALFALLPATGWSAEPCGQLWVDYSGSADAREMALAKQGWLDLVARAEQTGIRCWQMFGFYSNAYSARPFYTLRLPAAPQQTECRALDRKSECGLFRKCRDAAVQQAQERCDQERGQAEEEYRRALHAKIGEASQVLGKAQVPPADRCTAVYDLLERLATQPERLVPVLILTDGAETCDPRPREIIAPAGRINVAMVIVSKQTNKRAAGQYFHEMKQIWSRQTPWVKVIPPYALGISAVVASSPVANAN